MTKFIAITVVSTLLAIIVLAAPLQVPAPSGVAFTERNTIIYKSNSAWPVNGFITIEPCQLRPCYAI